jgi:succinoglycan biosynthesis protein ExoO
VKVLVNEHNGGLFRARNQGVAGARGEWVTFLDGDDWWAPDRLERLLRVAEQEEADVVGDDCHIINDGARSPWTTDFTLRRIRLGGVVTLGAVDLVTIDVGLCKLLARRQFLVQHEIRFDELLKQVADFKYGLECVLRGARFVVVPEAYYFYRRRDGQLTQDALSLVTEICEVLSALLRDVEICADGRLYCALARKLEFFKREESYQRMAQPVKDGRYGAACGELLRHPERFSVIVERLPRVLRRQIIRARWRLRELFSNVLE